MKHILPLLLLCLVAISLGTTGCEDEVVDAGSANKMTVDGDGYDDEEVTGTGSVAVVSGPLTSISMTGTINGEPFTLSMGFTGTAAGDYSWGGTGTAALAIGSTGSKSYVGTTGTTKVTSFGDIGGKVEGTFSGTLSDAQGGGGSIEVSGEFSAIRQ